MESSLVSGTEKSLTGPPMSLPELPGLRMDTSSAEEGVVLGAEVVIWGTIGSVMGGEEVKGY